MRQKAARVCLVIAVVWFALGQHRTMRQKAARVCLVIAVVWFILGFFVLGNAPEWFVISAAFAALAAFLGVRLVRMTGAVLVVASVVVAVGDRKSTRLNSSHLG